MDQNHHLKAGQEAPTGVAAITVEKHKADFKRQYGIFKDKPSDNITRWLEKATKYQEAHMIPSLEMASIVISCIEGEPAIKITRMLEAPDEDYPNADHFSHQEKQDAVKYRPYKPRVDPKKAVTDGTGKTIQEEVKQQDAEPTVYPVRFQPYVPEDKCLKYYLLDIYGKRVNLAEADKFLTTFKTQKPRQTCSNFLDEFAINYENYAHLKWSQKELNGTPAKEATLTSEKVDKIPSNIKQRREEMLRLVADGLCSEFKTHCDNTKFELATKTYIEIEKEVMYWQRSTTTGKKFVASCIQAKPTAGATVAALEFEEYLDKVENPDSTNEVVSSTQLTQQSTRGQGGGRGRGSARGNRGRGGRGRGASTGTMQKPVISRDVEDGNHPNYKQTPDGQLQRSIHGFPLCNYCGGPSHKRQNCPVKLHDRAAGNRRITHPDRDKGTSVQEKIKKQEQAKTSATMMAPMDSQVPWQYKTWPQQQQTAATMPYQESPPFQQQNQMGHIGASMQNLNLQNPQHQVSATNIAPKPTPCPYPTCHAVFTDPNQTQAHMTQFHTLPTLARGPGAEL